MVLDQCPKAYQATIAHMLVNLAYFSDLEAQRGAGQYSLGPVQRRGNGDLPTCRGMRHSPSLMTDRCLPDWAETSQKSNSGLCMPNHPTPSSYLQLLVNIDVSFQKSWPTFSPSTTGKKMSIAATFLSWKQVVQPWIVPEKTGHLQGVRILSNGFSFIEKFSGEEKNQSMTQSSYFAW